MSYFSLSRFAARPLGFVPLLWAALLCLLAPTRPASADVFFSTDTTINSVIVDTVYVTGSTTVALVPGGSIGGNQLSYSLHAEETSTVNVLSGSIEVCLLTYGTMTTNITEGEAAQNVELPRKHAILPSSNTPLVPQQAEKHRRCPAGRFLPRLWHIATPT
jgi:hypothetical protein